MLVSRDIRSWESFRANEHGFDCTALKDSASALEACNSDFLIAGVRKPIGVDDWVRAGIIRDNGDVAPRERRDKGNADGSVVLEVWRPEDEVVQGSCVGIQREDFNIGPVSAENGIERGSGRI